MRFSPVGFHQPVYFIMPEHGKDLYELFRIIVCHIEPELVKLIRSGLGRIEPYIACLSLAEFLPVTFRYKRTCQGVGLAPALASDELRTCYNIPPLVGTAHLQPAAIG